MIDHKCVCGLLLFREKIENEEKKLVVDFERPHACYISLVITASKAEIVCDMCRRVYVWTPKNGLVFKGRFRMG